ncbi:hypothetical protein AB3X52_07700 [Nocardioides sp. DS6]|uniref:DUF2567 domain-containing protein n=1 Tax=Nocardioides eburneus TaxID=3231482 RepID=A0ABV3SX30_9ACTN
MSDQLTTPTTPPLEAAGSPPSRQVRVAVLQAVATVVLGAVVGVVGGWLVERLWSPAATGMVVDHRWYRGVVSLDPPLVAQNADQRVFAGIGWFVVVTVVGGLVVGLVSALFLARRELVTLVAVTVATVGAGFVTYAVATALAPPDPARAAATARNGTVLSDTLHLGSHWVVLACPAGGLAALAAVFLMLYSRPRG